MTMPDRIQITHRPKTMTTPDFRTALERLVELDKRVEDVTGIEIDNWVDAMDAARAALKAEPEGESPRPDGDWFTVALLAQDMRSRGLAEQVAGEELLKLANGKRSQPGRPSPTPPSPVPGEVGEVGEVAQWLHAHALDCRGGGRNDWAEQCTRAATLLQQQCAPPAPEPRLTFQDAIHLAEGCHDYSGGHSGTGGEAWHGAIGTVVTVLKRAADGPWDSQTRAVYGAGVEAGEVAVPEPVAWCLSDEFENAMKRGGSFNGWKDPGAGANKCDMQLYAIPLPAPQAGEVEA